MKKGIASAIPFSILYCHEVTPQFAAGKLHVAPAMLHVFLGNTSFTRKGKLHWAMTFWGCFFGLLGEVWGFDEKFFVKMNKTKRIIYLIFALDFSA